MTEELKVSHTFRRLTMIAPDLWRRGSPFRVFCRVLTSSESYDEHRLTISENVCRALKISEKMPHIFDNIEQSLLPALQEALGLSERADFSVGYFNLRGWKKIDKWIDRWVGGPEQCCRLLVGMQRLPQDELYAALGGLQSHNGIDTQTALRLKKKLAEDFRAQLMIGVPTNEDEAGLPSPSSPNSCQEGHS